MTDRTISPPGQYSQSSTSAKQKPSADELFHQGSTNIFSTGETTYESKEFVYDCGALIDVVTYLLERRQKRILAAESGGDK